MIAALYVLKDGCYFGLPNVDPWDESRDARQYPGPYAVVAHPPCARWSVLANVNFWRYGTPRGEDGGCFAAALRDVRAYGGVLEHPARSMAFEKFNLPHPRHGFWYRGKCGGFSTEVCQRNYGHRAIKRTWLYYFGKSEPPKLHWEAPEAPEAWISTDRPMSEMRVELMGKKERLQTPILFRDLLINIAEGAQ